MHDLGKFYKHTISFRTHSCGGGIVTLKNKILNDTRITLLKQCLEKKGFVRVIEAHNGLSAIIGNDASVTLPSGEKEEFDALWISSLTDSSARGQPDAEILGFESRLQTINDVLEVTTKPIILDGDTGRDFTYFEYMVKKLERAGVSAVIIEDKVYPKRNSLDDSFKQDLEDPKVFAKKIQRGKKALISDNFMIIARIESLIAKKGIDDALMRAKEYLLAGVDGIMIHSKNKSGEDILEFSRKYKDLCQELGIKNIGYLCIKSYIQNQLKEFLNKDHYLVLDFSNILL
jgi:phosphoenolpyruvate phosphomutase